MNASYHRLAIRDVRQILDYYEREAGAPLADRFFENLLSTISKALARPQHFPPLGEFMRRANLSEFPYHVLYQETSLGIKVLVVRHHRRNPQFGMRRR